MKMTRPQLAILLFTAFYTLAYAAFYIRALNTEFIGYVGVIVIIFGLLYGTLDKTRMPTYILAGLSLWGLMHMMGGSVQTEDGVLYAWRIYPFYDGGGEFYILKFDQFVHGYLYAIVAVLFLHLLRHYFCNHHSQILVAFIALCAAMGVSALNELIEFIAVLTVPDNGVGGYFNLALDMVFNFAGALLGVIAYYLYHCCWPPGIEH
jgi:putative membrane protein